MRMRALAALRAMTLLLWRGAAAVRLPGGPTSRLISRRALSMFPCAAAAAVAARASAATVYDGEYRDPNHPDGFRRITSSAAGAATIVGKDEPGAATWTISAVLDDGGSIALEIAPGSVQPPEGVAVEDLRGDGALVSVFRGKYDDAGGAPGILWPDGNKWLRK